MKDLVDTLPGIERIRERFLDLLEERQAKVAHHVLAAWDSAEPADTNDHLQAAEGILHQIAGTAGTLGFGELGQVAQNCEHAIVAHVSGQNFSLADPTADIMGQTDMFVSMSNALLADQDQL